MKPCKHNTATTPTCDSCKQRRESRKRWREKNKDYSKSYYATNKKALSEKAAQRYQLNSDNIKKKTSNKYAANPTVRKLAAKLWRENNQDRCQENHHRYYLANIEKFQERSNRSEEERQKERDRVKRHNDAHPEQRLARVAKRRSIKMGIISTELFTWRDVVSRDGLRCYICGLDTVPECVDLKLRPTIEHLIPLISGGPHTLERTAIAHFSCNCSKSRLSFNSILDVPQVLHDKCRKRISEYLGLV